MTPISRSAADCTACPDRAVCLDHAASVACSRRTSSSITSPQSHALTPLPSEPVQILQLRPFLRSLCTLLLLVGAAVLLLPAGIAQAADEAVFAAAVKALDADSFTEKAEAAQALAALGDPRAAAVLAALVEGQLTAASDGTILCGGMTECVSGKIRSDLNSADSRDITVNNRLRGQLRGLLGTLELTSPDPLLRTRAAEAAIARPDPASAGLLQTAVAVEKDSKVKALLQTALALVQLQSSDRGQRLAAIDALNKGADTPALRANLAQLIDAEQDADVKNAAQKALRSLENKLAWLGMLVNLFQGLSLGSVLLLAAIGLAITFGVMGVINMAHGEMIMLGAYTTFVVQEACRAWLPPAWSGIYLILALPAAFLVSGAVGILLERGIIRFLYGRPLETLLATFGISLILQQLVRSIFGAPNKEVANPAWMTGGFDLAGGFTLTWNRLIILAFCLLVLGGIAALLRWSAFGLQMRAVAQNRPMAAAMGIRTGRVDALTFGLGSGVAGLAGVALSQIGNVSPNLGQGYIVDSFMVVVFGGVGSLWGTLVGALSLGVVNKLLEPFAGAMLGKVLVLIFIILFIQKRPRGLFALKGRSVDN